MKKAIFLTVSVILLLIVIRELLYYHQSYYQTYFNYTNEPNEVITISDSIYGGKIKCFKFDQTICKNIKENKSWEKHILDLLLKYYKPNTNMLDIGCNYGCHSIGVANQIKKQNGSGKIYSFDIQPRILSLFNENIKENGLSDIVVSYPFGLSDKTETAMFNLPKNYNTNINPGGLSLISKDNGKYFENVEVQLKRLDDLNISNISVIKIDIEGYELEALEGGKQTISRDRPVILIEIWKKNKDQYFKWIKNNFPFYTIFHISHDDYLLQSL